MGRAVFMLDEKLGIKISVRVGPAEDTVQLICLGDPCKELTVADAKRISKALAEAADMASAQYEDPEEPDGYKDGPDEPDEPDPEDFEYEPEDEEPDPEEQEQALEEQALEEQAES